MNTSNQQTNPALESAQEYIEASGKGDARAIVEANRQVDLANEKEWTEEEIRAIEDGLIADGLYDDAPLPTDEPVKTFFNQLDELFAPLHESKEVF